MGLPSEENQPGAVDGTFYDDDRSPPRESSTQVNGSHTSLPYRQHGNTENNATSNDRPSALGGSVVEQDARERTRPNGRRPSGQQRMCGKCARHLTGQFVRALGDTYHLECFTCHVSSASLNLRVDNALTSK